LGDGLEKGADDGGGDDGDGGDEEEGDKLEDVEVRFGGSNLCYVFGWCLCCGWVRRWGSIKIGGSRGSVKVNVMVGVWVLDHRSSRLGVLVWIGDGSSMGRWGRFLRGVRQAEGGGVRGVRTFRRRWRRFQVARAGRAVGWLWGWW